MNQWNELVQIASCIQFSDEEDTIIWQYNSLGIYSVQSLYAIVNHRGVQQVYTPVMWRISVPPRLHIFLWLLANNKVLTRDNLAKRKQIEDKTCLFCKEAESVRHIFFDCYVAQALWVQFAEITGCTLITDFESLSKFWGGYRVVNVFLLGCDLDYMEK
jgi:hypothetical protein